MITRKGFDLGDAVEFQNSNRVWTRGQVVEIRRSMHRLDGPSGAMQETRPTTYVIAFKQHAKWKELELPTRRIRLVKDVKEQPV